MIDPIAPAGPDQADIVGHFRNIRVPVRDPHARLTMLGKLPLTWHQSISAHTHGRKNRSDTFRKWFASPTFQSRLGVEQVDVAGATFHEQKDDTFRLGRKMGNALTQRV